MTSYLYLERDRVYMKSSEFTNSDGDAIDKLNDCLRNYNNFCSNLNSVYSATASYLSKAAFNIYLCEEDNAKR